MIRGRHHALGKGGNSLIGSLRGWRRVEAQHVASTMKIVDDAVDLEQIEPVAHTAFRVRPGATVFDPPRARHRRDVEQWSGVVKWIES